MKFEFKVSKQANFYFFLHNLAKCEWPWPFRPPYNTFWKKKLENFSQEESRALKEFRKLYKKYFFKKYIGRPFFLKKDPWRELEIYLSSKDANCLKRVFSIWEEKFEMIWRENYINLINWKKELEREIEVTDRRIMLGKIEKTLSYLYNAPSPKVVKVFLMMNGRSRSKRVDSGIGGERGRGLEGTNIILIEISQCPLTSQKINYAFSVVFHELIHCCFSKSHLLHLIEEEFRGKSKVLKVEEIINRSLFPLGVLGRRFFNIKVKITEVLNRGSIKNINIPQARKILDLSERYVLNKNTIDRSYIREVKEILKC